MKKLLLILLALCLLPVPQAVAATELTVYTAVEVELMAPYKKSFEQANPGISIRWVRDSTGVITARLLAEKDAPKADAVFGLNVTSISVLDAQGLLQPYTPAGFDAVTPLMRDTRTPPAWVGMSACPAAISVNKRELARLGLPLPQSWADLTKPEYKGHIVMSNPASSGTAFTVVSTWVQAWGPEKAWEFMSALHGNIAMYSHSGAQPVEMAAKGETVIGISEAAFAQSLVRRGAPLEVIVLPSPTPLDMEGTAIIKGSTKLDAAQKLMDWSVSESLAAIVAPRACLTARDASTLAEARGIAATAGSYDFTLAGQQREAIIKEWRSRFDNK